MRSDQRPPIAASGHQSGGKCGAELPTGVEVVTGRLADHTNRRLGHPPIQAGRDLGDVAQGAVDVGVAVCLYGGATRAVQFRKIAFVNAGGAGSSRGLVTDINDLPRIYAEMPSMDQVLEALQAAQDIAGVSL